MSYCSGKKPVYFLNCSAIFSFIFLWIQTFPLKQQKNSTFLSIRKSLIREKFYFGRFAKEFFGSRKNLLAKVSAPKVVFTILKAHDHLFGQFLNMSIYITNKTYISQVYLSLFGFFRVCFYIGHLFLF